MNVFIFCAALFCEDCGIKVKVETPKPKGYLEDNYFTWDSDDYPKGPFPDGGGKADCPQYCDNCEVFLENPLTDDGHTYVIDAVESFLTSDHWGDHNVIREWFNFYNLKVTR